MERVWRFLRSLGLVLASFIFRAFFGMLAFLVGAIVWEETGSHENGQLAIIGSLALFVYLDTIRTSLEQGNTWWY